MVDLFCAEDAIPHHHRQRQAEAVSQYQRMISREGRYALEDLLERVAALDAEPSGHACACVRTRVVHAREVCVRDRLTRTTRRHARART